MFCVVLAMIAAAIALAIYSVMDPRIVSLRSILLLTLITVSVMVVFGGAILLVYA